MHLILPRLTLALPIAFGLVVAGVAASQYLPRATVTLHPRTSERTITHDISLSSHAPQPDFAKYILPARIVERTVEDTLRVERTGGRTDDVARGSIVLINDGNEEQALLPKTHLRHEATGTYFLTDTPITLAPHSRLAMTITAKEKGMAGNVAPGRFIVEKLPASRQGIVFGESTEMLTGGIRIDQPLPDSELAAAREQLLAALRERLRGELTAEAGGAAIHPDLLSVTAEEDAATAAPGSLASEFFVRLRVRGRAFLADETDILSLTLLALRSQLSGEEEFISYAPDSFRISVVKLDFDQGEARLQGTLTGTFAEKLGPTVLAASNLAGLSANEVREHWQRYPAVGEVEVTFFPFWVKTVPSRAGAVDVAIKATSP